MELIVSPARPRTSRFPRLQRSYMMSGGGRPGPDDPLHEAPLADSERVLGADQTTARRHKRACSRSTRGMRVRVRWRPLQFRIFPK